MEGRNSLFPDLVREDDRLASLLCFDYGPNVKLMLKQCIELIFGGFVSISKKMLEDHLHGGKYASPDQSLCQESVSVPTTNANPKRDFGMQDRLMKLKPKALDIVYEGIIMFTANNTRNWRDSLPKEQFDIAMDFARESKKLQKEVYFKRKMMIHVTRAERLGKNMEERRRKEMSLVLEKERLAKEIEKVGGLWCNKEVAEKYLKKLKTEKEKKSAFKIHMGFRQKVLGADFDKSLFLSSKGVLKTSDELLCNLVQIISVVCASDPGEVQNYSLPVIINKEKFQLEKDKIINKNNKCFAIK